MKVANNELKVAVGIHIAKIHQVVGVMHQFSPLVTQPQTGLRELPTGHPRLRVPFMNTHVSRG
jgi:hypothetical protein